MKSLHRFVRAALALIVLPFGLCLSLGLAAADAPAASPDPQPHVGSDAGNGADAESLASGDTPSGDTSSGDPSAGGTGSDTLPSPATCPTWNQWPSLAWLARVSAPPVAANGWVFIPINSTLYAFTTDGQPLGSIPLTGTIQGQPVVVRLSVENGDRHWYIFVTTRSGYLYKLSMYDDSPGRGALAVHSYTSISRGSCAQDELAGVTVQLREQSTGWSADDDLVIVLTRDACTDFTQNRVIALRASGSIGTPWEGPRSTAWVFNRLGERQMDYGSQPCSIDYALNRVYCATNVGIGKVQNTLWAIDSATGRLVWANPVGALRNAPALARITRDNRAWRHLFVAGTDAVLHAIDPDATIDADGHAREDWSILLSGTEATGVTANLWAESQAPYAGLVLAVDTRRVLHAVLDLGQTSDSALRLWDAFDGSAGYPPIAQTITAAASLGKLYVGAADGKVWQLDYASGNIEASRTVAPLTGTEDAVSLPPLLFGSNPGDSRRLLATATSDNRSPAKSFCIPFAWGSVGQ